AERWRCGNSTVEGLTLTISFQSMRCIGKTDLHITTRLLTCGNKGVISRRGLSTVPRHCELHWNVSGPVSSISKPVRDQKKCCCAHAKSNCFDCSRTGGR